MREVESPGVRRAERFEVVDGQGRVRAVLGLLDGPAPAGQLVGLELRDVSGQPRATVAVGDDGAWMLLELEGNARLHLGVYDPASDALNTRVFLYLCDADGRPVTGWRVTDEGRAEPVEER